MSWSVEKLDHRDIIKITYSGHTNIDDITQATVSALSKVDNAVPNNFITILNDVELDIASHELHNINFLWDTANANKGNKLAIVDEKKKMPGYIVSFFVAVSQSHGWNVQFFSDYNEAEGWLIV